MTVRFYSSVAPPTTLTSTINSSATTISLASTTGLPGSFPFTLALDFGQVNEELVEVTSLGGLSATITRAIDGTSATTHNASAVVRHVSSARDFADSRNHENSSAGVHGLAFGSALVGTIDTQTLSNKTLASPVITGTASGNVTFSGNLTFTGTESHSNAETHTGTESHAGASTHTGAAAYVDAPVVFESTTPTNPVIGMKVVGDANSRAGFLANGILLFSDGTLAADTNLYRVSANLLATDDRLQVGQGVDIRSTVADSINLKASTTNTGTIAVRLRDSVSNSVFTIDDKGNILTGSVTETAGTAWINNSANLVWTTSTGLHSPSLGNATVNYWYKLISGTLFISFGMDFGSTTNFGGGTTSDNWQFSMPSGFTASTPWRANRMEVGHGHAIGTTAFTSPFIVRMDSTGGNLIFDTSGGNQGAIALGTGTTNAGLVDAITPFPWTTSSAISFTAAVPVF